MDKLPEWAHGMRPADIRLLKRAIVRQLAARIPSATPVFDLEKAIVTLELSENEHLQFGLYNIARALLNHPRSEWGRLIAAHFSSLPVPGDRIEMDWPTAAPQLRLRLFRGQQPGVVQRPADAPGLWLAAVIDLPTMLVLVTDGHLAQWRRSAAEVLDLANRQLLAEPLTAPVPLNTPGGLIEHYAGASFLIAGRGVLDVAALAAEQERGLLFAVPRRTDFLVHRLSRGSNLHVLEMLLLLAATLDHDGPGAITADVFWWSAMGTARLRSELTRDGLALDLPVGLGRALNLLPETAPTAGPLN